MSSSIDAELVERIFKFLYVFAAGLFTCMIAVVGFAYRAGGDVREIKNFIKDSKPKIEEHHEKIADLDKRVTVLERD